jgi:hypothetical protein
MSIAADSCNRMHKGKSTSAPNCRKRPRPRMERQPNDAHWVSQSASIQFGTETLIS